MVGGAQAKRLTGALEALRRAKTPPERLDAVRRVREAADRLESEHLDAARADGMTWTEIGKVYGLTKQGAQQRFRQGKGHR